MERTVWLESGYRIIRKSDMGLIIVTECGDYWRFLPPFLFRRASLIGYDFGQHKFVKQPAAHWPTRHHATTPPLKHFTSYITETD
jgi:hypothetical protein